MWQAACPLWPSGGAGTATPAWETQVGAVLMALVTTIMTGPLFDRFIGPALAKAGP